MKINVKLIYFVLPFLMLIFSCEENIPIEPPVANQKLFNVSFNVSGFTSHVTPLASLKTSAVNQTMNLSVADLPNQITALEYLIYNSSGQLLKDSIQTSSSTFGTMNLQLPAGSYKLIVAGMRGLYTIYSKESSVDISLTSKYPSKIGDWFKQVADFVVNEQALNQNIVLDRVVGKVGFILTDAIPKDIAKISMGFTTGSYVLLNSSYSPGTVTQIEESPLKLSDEGKLNYSSSAFVIPMNTGSITTDVSIRAYNTSGTLIVEKIIKNVVVEKNKMTTLSGALFTSLPSSTTTNVTVNSDWKPSTTVTF